MKTLDWSVETLGRECSSIAYCIFIKLRVAVKHDKVYIV